MTIRGSNVCKQCSVTIILAEWPTELGTADVMPRILQVNGFGNVTNDPTFRGSALSVSTSTLDDLLAIRLDTRHRRYPLLEQLLQGQY